MNIEKEKYCECCGEIINNCDKFCSEECAEIYYSPEPEKPATKRQAAIIKIAPNSDKSYHL